MKIKEWVDKNDPGAIIIPFSGVFENKLADMEPDEKAKYIQDNGTTRWELDLLESADKNFAFQCESKSIIIGFLN